ncbi:MAG: dihydroorotate dehydrogenase [Proteobacteria bacterium]|nr:dihydroorotate dehydrogenase [Pseudomonadota bacterium]
MDLSVNLGNITLKNPFMPASGTFGYGLEFAEFGDLSQLGAIVTKGISLNPKKGNKPPRICEVKGGMINSIGLENVGIDNFQEKLKKLEDLNTSIVCNFFGNTFDEYISVAEKLSSFRRVDVLEVNISCPNVKEGGICFGTDERMISELIGEIRKVIKKPLWVKLTPNVSDITKIAITAEKAGADALVVANTYTAMSVDIASRRPKIKNIYGGMSGPAIKPLSLYNVFRCVKSVSIPVIGCGGITDISSALEFLIVGARAVQVGTANFINPKILWNLIDDLNGYLSREKISLMELIGSLITE